MDTRISSVSLAPPGLFSVTNVCKILFFCQIYAFPRCVDGPKRYSHKCEYAIKGLFDVINDTFVE